MVPHSQSKSELLSSLQTTQEQGLTATQAAQRLSQYGLNKLAEKKPKTNLQRFLAQFKSCLSPQPSPLSSPAWKANLWSFSSRSSSC